MNDYEPRLNVDANQRVSLAILRDTSRENLTNALTMYAKPAMTDS